MTDYIREYWAKIQSGEETVSKKVHAVYKEVVRLLDHSEEYYYNERRAEHALRFIMQFCRQSKGKDGGKPLELLLWQRAMICVLFGILDANGLRKYRELFLVVGRKNGKSTLASGIGLYMLYADAENGPEVYSVATTRDQAKLSWNEAKKMINKSPSLRKKARPLVGEILTDFNDGVFKPLAADSNTLDGLNPSAAIMDEVAAWKNGQALYDVIVDGESAREEPLNIMITTAGTVREDIFDILYDRAERLINNWQSEEPGAFQDEHFLPLIYELDNRDEWTDEDAWKKANPSLGPVKDPGALRYKVEKAKANPMLVRNLLCKDFNIRETDSAAWLNFEELNNTDTFTLDKERRQLCWVHDGEERVLSYPRYGIGGVDLSKTTDLCAAKVLFRVPEAPEITFVLSQYWLPEQPGLDQLETEQKIPWTKWEERGLLRTCPGNIIRYRDVVEWFVHVQEELDIYVSWFGYDAWSANYFVEDMSSYFGSAAGIAVHQGKKTLSDPMQRLGAELRAHRIVYNNNPLDKWCLANTTYEEDKNGNIQPHKTNRPTRKIDGTAALLDAWVVLVDRMQDYMNMI